MKQEFGEMNGYNALLLEKSLSAIYEIANHSVSKMFLANGGAASALIVFADPLSGNGFLRISLALFFIGMVSSAASQILTYVGHRDEFENAARRLDIHPETIFAGKFACLKGHGYVGAFNALIFSFALLLLGGLFAGLAL